MKVYCVKTYKTEIDILDLPKIEHTVFKIGHLYDLELVNDDLDIPDEEYSVIGEDGVFVTFPIGELNKHFIYGISNIRDVKLDMIGI